jgi:hypothetical protein
MAADNPIWKIAALAAVVVAVTSFAGGGFTYGTLSDAESAHVELGAATDFGTTSTGNAPTQPSMQTHAETSVTAADETPTPTPTATPAPTATPSATPDGDGTETATTEGGADSSTPARLGDNLVTGGAL